MIFNHQEGSGDVEKHCCAAELFLGAPCFFTIGARELTRCRAAGAVKSIINKGKPKVPEVRTLNREAAKQQPEGFFKKPLDIVNEVLLTKGEKLATLERWRLNILAEIDAVNEGMATHGYTAGQLGVLEQIEEAKACLDKTPDAKA